MDALVSCALHNEIEARDQECPAVYVAPVRTCEFCGSSNTPTWRRGPAGKASLCNACGIKWRLRKRMKKGDQPERSPKESPEKPKKKKEKKQTLTPIAKTIFKEKLDVVDRERDYRKKGYFCKYCNKTWAFTHFKNSQQFGAHCSNCSRRPRSKSVYEVPSVSASPISDSEQHYFYDEYAEEEVSSPYEEEMVPNSPPPAVYHHHQSDNGELSRLLNAASHQMFVEETPRRREENDYYEYRGLHQLASIADIRQRFVLSRLASIVAN